MRYNKKIYKKEEVILISIICFLSGIIVGFLISPKKVKIIKGGIKCGNNNTSTNKKYYKNKNKR